jgi:hypothetical protein
MLFPTWILCGISYATSQNHPSTPSHWDRWIHNWHCKLESSTPISSQSRLHRTYSLWNQVNRRLQSSVPLPSFEHSTNEVHRAGWRQQASWLAAMALSHTSGSQSSSIQYANWIKLSYSTIASWTASHSQEVTNSFALVRMFGAQMSCSWWWVVRSCWILRFLSCSMNL